MQRLGAFALAAAAAAVVPAAFFHGQIIADTARYDSAGSAVAARTRTVCMNYRIFIISS